MKSTRQRLGSFKGNSYHIRTISVRYPHICTISVRYPYDIRSVHPPYVRRYGVFAVSLRHLYGICAVSSRTPPVHPACGMYYGSLPSNRPTSVYVCLCPTGSRASAILRWSGLVHRPPPLKKKKYGHSKKKLPQGPRTPRRRTLLPRQHPGNTTNAGRLVCVRLSVRFITSHAHKASS